MKMKKTLLAFGTVASIVAPIASVVACGSSSTETAYKEYSGATITENNTYFVTDGGSLTDKTFNQSVFEGAKEAGMPSGNAIPSPSAAGIGDSYVSAKSQNASLIVASGFNHSTAMGEFTQDHSDVGFVFVDGTLEATKEDGTKVQQGNVASIIFATEQAAFVEGVAAAAESSKGTKNKIGVYGGMDIPSVNAYIKGLEAGIKFFNDNKADGTKEVGIEWGGYVGDFNIGGQSKTIATKLVNDTDLVMSVGGPQYKDVFSAIDASEKSVKVIGVDVDLAAVETGDASKIFGSITKNLKDETTKVVKEIYADNGKDEFGKVDTGTLENNGVAATSKLDDAIKLMNGKTEAEINAAAIAFKM